MGGLDAFEQLHARAGHGAAHAQPAGQVQLAIELSKQRHVELNEMPQPRAGAGANIERPPDDDGHNSGQEDHPVVHQKIADGHEHAGWAGQGGLFVGINRREARQHEGQQKRGDGDGEGKHDGRIGQRALDLANRILLVA